MVEKDLSLFDQFLNWLFPKRHVTMIPATGLFTYGDRYRSELIGTQIEVKITEVFPEHFRVEYINSITVTQYCIDNNLRGCPPIVEMRDVKVLTWKEVKTNLPPALPPGTEETLIKRNIKLE